MQLSTFPHSTWSQNAWHAQAVRDAAVDSNISLAKPTRSAERFPSSESELVLHKRCLHVLRVRRASLAQLLPNSGKQPAGSVSATPTYKACSSQNDVASRLVRLNCTTGPLQT